MIHQPNGTDLVVPINASFWPTFLSSRLSIAAVKQAWCFCLNRDKQEQLILVVATEGATALPTPEDLCQAFPLDLTGRYFQDLRDIPLRLYSLLELTGVYLHQLQLTDRQLTVLYGTNEYFDEVTLADSVLVSLQIPAESEEETPWIQDEGNYHVLISKYSARYKVFNVIALVRSNAAITFTPRLVVLASILGDRFRVTDISGAARQ